MIYNVRGFVKDTGNLSGISQEGDLKFKAVWEKAE